MAVKRDYFKAIYDEGPYNETSGRKIHRVCRVIHDLDKHKPGLEEIETLNGQFAWRRDHAKSQELFAEYALICGHLSWLGALQKDDALIRQFRSFSHCTNDEGLVRRSGHELKDDASILFLLPNHERSVSSQNSDSEEYRRDLFETLPREHFFPQILSVINSVWQNTNLGLSPQTLDAHMMLRNRFVQFMHKQLLQNALTHAYADVTFNRNYNPSTRSHFAQEGDDFLFGVLAYLEVQVLDPRRVTIGKFSNELSSYHSNLGERGEAIFERLKQRKARLCIFSYCDTGPGIERHLINFSPKRADLPKSFDVRFVLDHKLSGRTSINSGEGLSDVRALAEEASAVLVIETPSSIYIDDAVAGVEVSQANDRLSRGTAVSMLFEV